MQCGRTSRCTHERSWPSSCGSCERNWNRLVPSTGSRMSAASGIGCEPVTEGVAPGGGETFGGYTIESVLGRGGMGTVYLATHKRLARRVALKVITPELA